MIKDSDPVHYTSEESVSLLVKKIFDIINGDD